MPLFHKAAFFKSAARLDQFPASQGEIAFAGRSNAGKSSAINALAGRRLAFVSKTPGRTQLVNFYALGEGRFLVDLPGYGYSKAPAAARALWEELLGAYLQTRGPLRGAVVVMDVRQPLTVLDCRMLEWFRPTGRPVHVLLTKADKLSRAAACRVLLQVEAELALLAPNFSAQLFSSLKRLGLGEAEAVLGKWLDPHESAPGRDRELAAVPK